MTSASSEQQKESIRVWVSDAMSHDVLVDTSMTIAEVSQKIHQTWGIRADHQMWRVLPRELVAAELNRPQKGLAAIAAMDFRSAPAPPSLRQIAFNIRVEAEHAKHAETVSHSVWQAVFRADMMARQHMLEAKRRSEWMELLATGAEAAAAADLTAARAAASSDSRFDHSRSPPRTPKKKM